MPLLLNYLNIPDCFSGWNASFAKNLISNAENSVNFRHDCDGNQLKYSITMTYLQLETRIMHYRNLSKQIFWQYSARHNQGGPRLPILHSNIFFYVKLFATIILSWNSLKCIIWYLLKLSDPFIKNENSVLPILIEKNFEQNFTFLSWKWYLFLLKKGIQIFSVKLGQRLPKSFSQLHVKNSRYSPAYFLKKDDWPKAYAGPRLPTLPFKKNVYLVCIFLFSNKKILNTKIFFKINLKNK